MQGSAYPTHVKGVINITSPENHPGTFISYQTNRVEKCYFYLMVSKTRNNP